MTNEEKERFLDIGICYGAGALIDYEDYAFLYNLIEKQIAETERLKKENTGLRPNLVVAGVDLFLDNERLKENAEQNLIDYLDIVKESARYKAALKDIMVYQETVRNPVNIARQALGGDYDRSLCGV